MMKMLLYCGVGKSPMGHDQKTKFLVKDRPQLAHYAYLQPPEMCYFQCKHIMI